MDQFPAEIWIRILRYLNTYDLMQFCVAFKNMNYFLQEKNVISCVDFSRKFELMDTDICKFISHKMNPNVIKTLKINGIYWIPAQNLISLLSKLSNLEELCAIDTKLGFKSKYLHHYVKLKKLALSLKIEDIDLNTILTIKQFKNLKKLYLKIIYRDESFKRFSLFFQNLLLISELREIWIKDNFYSNHYFNYERLFIELNNIEKIVSRVTTGKIEINYDLICLTKTFDCKRTDLEQELIFEKIENLKPRRVKSIFEPKEGELQKSWDIFENLPISLPCGPEESKLLSIGEDLKNIKFVELHFSNFLICNNLKYTNSILEILKSENCRNLRKLNFRSCIFQDFVNNEKQEQDVQVTFKKARIGVKTKKVNQHPFQKVVSNLSNLNELEVYTCAKCINETVISVYPLIANFANLKKLTVEIPFLLNGNFLQKVLINCHFLESISLIFTSTNEIFLQNFYQYIKFAVALKDLRIECSRINLENLFCSLNEITSKKLLRLFIKCNNITYSQNINETELFSTFLQKQIQLCFFVLIVSDLTAKKNSCIQKIMREFKKGKPAKVFYCHQYSDYAIDNLSVHEDIILNQSNVSVIDFERF